MKFFKNFRGLLEPALVIGVDKGNDSVGHHQNLLNLPQADDVMYQSVQKVQPPCADNVVLKDKIPLREVPEA